jgi:transposase
MGYSEVTDEVWEDIAWLLPEHTLGRRSTRDREVFNAILYVLWTGCRWDERPKHFPPKSTVHYRFQMWAKAGFFEKVLRRFRRHLPEAEVYHLDCTLKMAKKGGRLLAGLVRSSAGPRSY